MAKRRRLTPAQSDYLGTATAPDPAAGSAPGSAPQNPAAAALLGAAAETKSALPGAGFSAPPLASSPPIAQVAGEASTTAALLEVTEMLETARAQGRMILRLDLDSVEADYLVRDRLDGDAADLDTLMASLRARGQQTPIEVAPLRETFGLISGWRRLTALRRLYAETGEDRFNGVLAILRAPETASDAYVAMVEENEIRVGLSYFERARIVDRSVAQGVFDDDRGALQSLFATASRAKRSKIGSFLTVVRLLEHDLRFPAHLNERVGLRLSKALEDRSFAGTLPERLMRTPAASAEEERAFLTRQLDAWEKATAKAAAARAKPVGTSPVKEPVSQSPDGSAQGATRLRPGLTLQLHGTGPARRCELSGPDLDDALLRDLEAWLRAR